MATKSKGRSHFRQLQPCTRHPKRMRLIAVPLPPLTRTARRACPCTAGRPFVGRPSPPSLLGRAVSVHCGGRVGVRWVSGWVAETRLKASGVIAQQLRLARTNSPVKQCSIPKPTQQPKGNRVAPSPRPTALRRARASAAACSAAAPSRGWGSAAAAAGAPAAAAAAASSRPCASRGAPRGPVKRAGRRGRLLRRAMQAREPVAGWLQELQRWRSLPRAARRRAGREGGVPLLRRCRCIGGWMIRPRRCCAAACCPSALQRVGGRCLLPTSRWKRLL